MTAPLPVAARAGRRSRSAALILLIVTFAGACSPQATLPPNPTVAAPHAYSVCPQSGELPPKDVNDQAVSVLRERLSLLGVATPEITLGACIEIALEVTSQDPDTVQSALLGTGRVELFPVPADQADAIHTGSAGPVGVQPIVASADLADAAITAEGGGQPVLELTMTPAGATALGAWTAANVGGFIALVVDGVVAAVPVIAEPIQDGSVQIGFGATPPIALEALRVMVLSGPLPEAWAQPERPQG